MRPEYTLKNRSKSNQISYQLAFFPRIMNVWGIKTEKYFLLSYLTPVNNMIIHQFKPITFQFRKKSCFAAIEFSFVIAVIFWFLYLFILKYGPKRSKLIHHNSSFAVCEITEVAYVKVLNFLTVSFSSVVNWSACKKNGQLVDEEEATRYLFKGPLDNWWLFVCTCAFNGNFRKSTNTVLCSCRPMQ